MSSQIIIACIRQLLHFKLTNGNVKQWPPHPHSHITHFHHSFVVVCLQMMQATIASHDSVNLIIGLNFTFPPLGLLYPSVHPIAATSLSCHIKFQIWYPFINPTKHIWMSKSIQISIQMSCGDKVVVTFHNRFDTFTLWWDRDDGVLASRRHLCYDHVFQLSNHLQRRCDLL